jgi:hypothetical protein
VFASQAGSHASLSSAGVARGAVIDGVQTVFLVAAPLAALALIVVLYLPESSLRTNENSSQESNAA